MAFRFSFIHKSVSPLDVIPHICLHETQRQRHPYTEAEHVYTEAERAYTEAEARIRIRRGGNVV